VTVLERELEPIEDEAGANLLETEKQGDDKI
jgi:hypothetical protein